MDRAVLGLSALLLAISVANVHAIPPPPPDDVRIVRVIDGNTIVVTPSGDPFQVRLACIHAPHLRQGTAGRAAKAALERLLPAGAWVTLATRSKAPDGVELAEILPSGASVPINLSLVRDGMAFMDRHAASPCNRDRYQEAEWNARARRLGLWRRSAFTHPLRP
jgi:endonuclease YncB( thermonuclease family)